MSQPYDPYRACALCRVCETTPQGRVCAHPELNRRPIEDARARLGGCGPEATKAVAAWAKPA